MKTIMRSQLNDTLYIHWGTVLDVLISFQFSNSCAIYMTCVTEVKIRQVQCPEMPKYMTALSVEFISLCCSNTSSRYTARTLVASSVCGYVVAVTSV